MSFWNNNKTPVGGFGAGLGSAGGLNTNSVANALEATRDAERLYREAMSTVRYDPTMSTAPRAAGSMSPKIENRRDRELMLSIRMRVSVDDLPFDDIHTSLGKEKVFVFIRQNDKPVIFEDDIHLYPSDTLITQLRLIAK